MADVTQVFKSTVKMVKVRKKELTSINAGSGDDTKLSEHTKHLLRSKSHIDEENNFSSNAKEIVANITGLKNFLLKNRRAYLAASSNLPLELGQNKLTEAERDKIDNDAMQYMKLCKEMLTKCKAKALAKHLSAQQREHRTIVMTMIDEYLRVVCQLYSEQRAIRVKKAVDHQKMGQLGFRKSFGKPETMTQSSNNKTESTSQPASSSVFEELVTTEPEQTEISAEEAQMFKEENEQLYNELNSTLDEVRQIQGKVVEISRLQEIFTEKVLEQDADINRIGDQMVDSTENIVQGNEDIREAMKNNAGMRVWIIFGIGVLSFTLLFLDWYND